MLIHPQFDPVAFRLGFVAMSWYGLMYCLAFLSCWGLAHYRIKKGLSALCTAYEINDSAFHIFLAVVVGGRLGYVLFYNPAHYLAHPLEIFATWQGGMSFHGGFLAVTFTTLYLVRKHHKNWWQATDFLAPIVPFGLMLGRVGNFINGELWGRPADPGLPWAMIFPRAGDTLPRHPVQLYHAGLEGLALFALLWFYCRRERPTGSASGFFLIGYGCFRVFAEFFREPDRGILAQSYPVTLGQWLSLPLIALGVFLVWLGLRKTRPAVVIPGAFFLGYGVFRVLVEFFRAPEHGGIFSAASTVSIGQCLSIPMIVLGVFLVWVAHIRHAGVASRVWALLNLDYRRRD
ncbi:MAG: prolipoprotein diacylglyceryl transferase [Zoogloeaceae bacterium]|jgi:phosphatidylglycerol:prolipoprotein diacylglycerol transferase|nr:prolipoprotein diacylglyceryl transferase [Zoogloeaceae bacterium]